MRGLVIALCALACMSAGQATAQQPAEDPTQACGLAAARAEHEWRLPPGLLAAVGIVESGRRTSAGLPPIIWPWTINAEGRGFYAPSKAVAIDAVRMLRLRGVRLIDVGCFQVDLFYHPLAFETLEQAFEPDANASAAALILISGRFRSTGWDGAIAAYHSSIPLSGAAYLQKVGAIWSSVTSRTSWADSYSQPLDFAALLSPQALLVRVITPDSPVQPPAIGLPQVIEVDPARRPNQTDAIVQWLQPPSEALPIVLPSGEPRSARRGSATGWPNTGRTSSR
jgi:hypothetical protein